MNTIPADSITIDDQDYFGRFHNPDEFMCVKDGYEDLWRWPGDISSGFFYLIKLRPGLILTIMDHYATKPILINFRDNADCFAMSFFLPEDCGFSTLQINGLDRRSLVVEPSRGYLTYMPGHSGVEQLPHKTKFYAIGILLAPWLMERFWDNYGGSIPAEFSKTLNRPSVKHYYHQSLSITPMINLLLHEILGCRYQGSSKSYFLESKVLELLVRGFEQLNRNAEQTPGSFPFKRDNYDFVFETRDILIDKMLNPPSLSELARLAGVNKTKLNQCFRKVYGVSIFEYLRIFRLEKARDLLKNYKKTVTEVALEIGYSQQSSFTTEFKKYFGENPKEYRQ